MISSIPFIATTLFIPPPLSIQGNKDAVYKLPNDETQLDSLQNFLFNFPDYPYIDKKSLYGYEYQMRIKKMMLFDKNNEIKFSLMIPPSKLPKYMQDDGEIKYGS